MNNKTNKNLIIIAGAAGEIGTEFIKSLLEQEDNQVIGIMRNTPLAITADNLEMIQCSLDREDYIIAKFAHVDVAEFSRVIYLHTIGVDKFNARNYPNISKMETIDPDVYDTNVNSFKYLLRYLARRIEEENKKWKNILLKTVAIAGTSDKFTPFVIEDFCEAKFIVREYIRSYVGRFPEWFSGLAINLTSTETKSALAVRPHADTKYWFTPSEIVEESIQEFNSYDMDYKELDLIKFSPNYVDGYYENKELLYTKWVSETGYVPE